MSRCLAALLLALAASSPPAAAQPDGVHRPGMMTKGTLPAAVTPRELARVRFEQRLGAQVPLDLPFLDESGRPARLSQYVNGRPVVLALVYYECPMLCTRALNGLAGALKVLALEPGRDYNVVVASVDPSEKPVQAAEKKDGCLQILRRPGAGDGWHFLTGPEASIRRLTGVVGFHDVFDQRTRRFAHPSGIVVLTPDGKVSKYVYGIEYEPRDLRLALVEAADGRIGTPVDRRVVYCHLDDPGGRKPGIALLAALRLAGVVTVACLAALIVILRRRERRAGALAPGDPLKG